MSKSLARKYAELFDKEPENYERHTQLFGEMVRAQPLEPADARELAEALLMSAESIEKKKAME